MLNYVRKSAKMPKSMKEAQEAVEEIENKYKEMVNLSLISKYILFICIYKRFTHSYILLYSFNPLIQLFNNF